MRGKQQAGPSLLASAETNRPQKQSRDLLLQFRLRLPPASCLPLPAWSLLAAVGRAVGVVAGAPLLLRRRRGCRRGGHRQQRPVQAQPLVCNRGQAAGVGPGVDNGNRGRCRHRRTAPHPFSPGVAGTAAAAPEAAEELIALSKKPRRKGTHVENKCAARVIIALFVCYCDTKRTKSNPETSLTSEQHIRVSYAELVSATNGFASENLIGAGSFGSVYKGSMTSNGQQQEVVAVKVLNLTQRGASHSFVAECETLRCIRHRNLVKILTMCSSIDFHRDNFKALVYEFLPNGNLDHWLHQRPIEDGERKALDLSVRIRIAIDVASALEYLHQSKPLPIIHCDLKPNNVLLDRNMVAHVGDFGLARFLHQDADRSSGWASMRGTIEYGLGNEVSMQGDVYSYGILLLEVFTGKRPTDNEFGEGLGLRKYVEIALPGRVTSVVDRHLVQETEDGEGIADMKISCIISVLRIGVQCSEEALADRMQISDALKELQGIRDKLQNIKHLINLEDSARLHPIH